MRISLLILLLYSESSMAIVNSESILSNPFKEGFSTQLELNYQKASGNVSALDFGLMGRIQYQAFYNNYSKYLKNQKGILASQQWSERNGTKISNQKFLNLRWTEMLNPNFGFEGFFQIEENQFQRLKMREIAGIGPRLSIYYFESFILNFGLHMAAEKNDILQSSSQLEYSTFKNRVNSYLSVRYGPNESIFSLQLTKFYQPNLQTFADFRTLTEVEVSISLTKLVSISFLVAEAYDSMPPEQVNSEDQKITNRIKLSF